MTRTRNADLANTRLLWRFTAPPKPVRRRQAEPVRPIYSQAVPWPIRIGEQPRAFWARYEHVIAIIVLVAIVVVAIYATSGKYPVPFRP